MAFVLWRLITLSSFVLSSVSAEAAQDACDVASGNCAADETVEDDMKVAMLQAKITAHRNQNQETRESVASDDKTGTDEAAMSNEEAREIVAANETSGTDEAKRGVELECSPFPSHPNYIHDNKQKCEYGNTQRYDPNFYVYNEGRDTSNAACSGNCWCCKAQPECTAYPTSHGSSQEKCEAGNLQHTGYIYIYNDRRGTPDAKCGQSANCNCCRVKKTGSGGGFHPPSPPPSRRRSRPPYNPTYHLFCDGYCSPDEQSGGRIGTWVSGTQQEAEQACNSNWNCRGFHWSQRDNTYVLVNQVGPQCGPNTAAEDQCYRK